MFYCSLRHISTPQLKQLTQHNFPIGLLFKNLLRQMCSICLHGKQIITKFSKVATFCTMQPLELAHSDLSSWMATSIFSNFKYYITFIDDYSWYIILHLLWQKINTLNSLKSFIYRLRSKLDLKYVFFESIKKTSLIWIW